MAFIKRFRLNSIRKKLFVLVIVNSGLALLLVGLLLFGYERFETRDTAERELSTEAGIVADSSAVALAFMDARASMETLKALRTDADIVQAATYTETGSLFARYDRSSGADYARLPPTAPQRGGAWFSDDYLLITRPVLLGNRALGTVFLKESMKLADIRLRRRMGFVSLALVIALALALLFSTSMQRTITVPVAALSNVAHLVSIGKDYSARAVKHADDEIGFLVDSFNGMLTQIEAREHKLRESEQRYALSARGSNDGLWDWNLPTNEVYFSSRWNQMLGFAETETWSDPDSWFNRIHESDRERVEAEIAAHRDGKTAEIATEYRIRQKSGAFVWVLTRGMAVRDGSGATVRMAGSQTDITQGKVADPLTGLPNRLYLIDRLESALDTGRREGSRFAVLFLDMDRFKLINDSMGHSAGDALLRGFTGRLLGSLLAATKSGNVSETSIVARLGGDEFAVLLQPVADASKAALLAETMLGDLNAPYLIAGRQIFASVSIGVALSCPGDTPEDLLRNADTAMYQAKTEGKARLAVFDEGMRLRAVARMRIESELRTAIEEGEMLLYFQPQVSIPEGRVTGFEALIRWKHPERGMISPGEFIPVAEETGLIVPLGSWVLREACRQIAQWQARFSRDPPLTVAVNVSLRQLVGSGFVDEVSEILRETAISPDSLRLEITESAVMRNPQESIEILRLLKATGVGLEVDDFGTGYSSLSYLISLPVDTVKIDQSFVAGLGAGGDRAEIVRTIRELARSLGLGVIAEGVETEEQLKKLIELGCGRAQGYYFSKPLPAESVPWFLEVEALKHWAPGRRPNLPSRPGLPVPERSPADREAEIMAQPV